MSSRKRGRKPKQQRLAFEPVAAASSAATNSSPSTGLGLSPARVRFSSPSKTQQSSPLTLPTVQPAKMPRRGRGASRKQQTLEGTLGVQKIKKTVKQRPAVGNDDDDGEDDELLPVSIGKNVQVRQRPALSPPRSSFMGSKKKGRRPAVVDDSDSSETPVEVDGGVTDSDGEGPLKQETPRQSKMGRRLVENLSDSSDDDGGKKRPTAPSSQSLPNLAAGGGDPDDTDDQPLVTPRSSFRRPVFDLDDDSEDDDIQTPAKRRRLVKGRRAPASVSDEDSNEDAEAMRKSTGGKSASRKPGSSPPPSTARSMRSGVRKGHRTEREKKMELLRRRKAGEKNLTIEDLTSSSSSDDGGALYDTDSDHQALEVFDDESEPEVEAPKKSKDKKKAKVIARKSSPADEDVESEDENFIDDDDDTLGVPDEALHLIPLEFTRASHKPLKAHFKDAIEWLIHRRINPGFDRDNEVYTTAWRRLDDEVTGLANSKFISSAWKPDFYRALKARPYIEQLELGAGHRAIDLENCQACGRSGHLATWSICFKGKPYDSKTLDEVDSESEDENEDEDDDDEGESGNRDADGNIIPPEDRQFFVGQTCNSNAETAHSLKHWKPALRDWVDAHLEGEGWMKPEKVLERERMKARKREKMAQQIVEGWHEQDVIRNLFNEFKTTIENARNKDTVSKGRRRY